MLLQRRLQLLELVGEEEVRLGLRRHSRYPAALELLPKLLCALLELLVERRQLLSESSDRLILLVGARLQPLLRLRVADVRLSVDVIEAHRELRERRLDLSEPIPAGRLRARAERLLLIRNIEIANVRVEHRTS